MNKSGACVFFFVILCVSIGSIQCTGLNVKAKSTVLPAISKNNSSAAENTTGSVKTDPRTGLVYSQGTAAGSNNGGNSYSQDTSVAAGGAIRDPYGQLNTLYNQAQSQGTGWSSGVGSPNTWASSNAVVRPGYDSQGYGTAGLSAGQGSAAYNNFVNTVEMPIGGGQTLLTNLKAPSNSTTIKPISSTTKSPPTKKE